MKMYCPKCGSATQYNGKKPNFCHSCGNAFAGVQHPTTVVEDGCLELFGQEQEEPTHQQVVPNISKLEIEITNQTQSKFKLGEVVGTLNPDNVGNDTFLSDGSPSPEQQLRDFEKEAGTLRKEK